jgi:hypothetical protein
MPTGARGYSDSPRYTVSELLKDPLVIPALILDITENEFIMDSVLRMGGAAPSGAVRYSESTPLYADDFPEIRPEFGEVPVVPTSIGVPRVVFSHERAMAIMVSDEMRRRQAIDPVTRQLLQVKNTMVYSWNTAFYSAVVANASIQTLAVANPWASAAATTRSDISQAKYLISNANIVSPSGVTQWLGFEPDTMIINHGTENTLIQSIVMQRHRAGFYADELPFMAGPLYREESRKTFRSDTQRSSAIGLDQPLAVCLLSGV